MYVLYLLIFKCMAFVCFNWNVDIQSSQWGLLLACTQFQDWPCDIGQTIVRLYKETSLCKRWRPFQRNHDQRYVENKQSWGPHLIDKATVQLLYLMLRDKMEEGAERKRRKREQGDHKFSSHKDIMSVVKLYILELFEDTFKVTNHDCLNQPWTLNNNTHAKVEGRNHMIFQPQTNNYRQLRDAENRWKIVFFVAVVVEQRLFWSFDLHLSAPSAMFPKP